MLCRKSLTHFSYKIYRKVASVFAPHLTALSISSMKRWLLFKMFAVLSLSKPIGECFNVKSEVFFIIYNFVPNFFFQDGNSGIHSSNWKAHKPRNRQTPIFLTPISSNVERFADQFITNSIFILIGIECDAWALVNQENCVSSQQIRRARQTNEHSGRIKSSI
jgi:hypothetical protein